MKKKYSLTAEVRVVNGVTNVFRIRALRDFGAVKAGDLGGFVQSEANLSHDGNCWVRDEACVWGEARVYGEAQVNEDARVFGNAGVFERAEVSGKATVCDKTRVFGEAIVMERAQVYGQATVSEKAVVCESARVCQKSVVFGNAMVRRAALLTSGFFSKGTWALDQRAVEQYNQKARQLSGIQP